MSAPGVVYLLHFLQPYAHARHYLGATGLTLDARISGHRTGDTGRPATLIRALLAAGGDFIIARTWETATRGEAFALERRLKTRGSRGRLCPLCRPRVEWPVGALAIETEAARTSALDIGLERPYDGADDGFPGRLIYRPLKLPGPMIEHDDRGAVGAVGRVRIPRKQAMEHDRDRQDGRRDHEPDV